MNTIQAIILGILQGATEFLPVSSSGHLVLVPWLLNWDDPGLVFDIAVHLGTLAAVVVYFWRDIVALLHGIGHIITRRRADIAEARLALLLAASAVPGAIMGFLLEDLFESIFGSPLTVSLLLVVTGGLLLLAERLGQRTRELDEMGLGDALAMGLAQGIAIAPGISRSGATMAAGLLRGLDRQAAARFSFLMSLPIILGATGFQVLKMLLHGAGSLPVPQLLTGCLAAAGSGYLAIRLLLNYVRTHSLRPFAAYCWAVAALGIVLNIVR